MEREMQFVPAGEAPGPNVVFELERNCPEPYGDIEYRVGDWLALANDGLILAAHHNLTKLMNNPER